METSHLLVRCYRCGKWSMEVHMVRPMQIIGARCLHCGTDLFYHWLAMEKNRGQQKYDRPQIKGKARLKIHDAVRHNL